MNCLQIFQFFDIGNRNRLPQLYLAKLLRILVLNALQILTLFTTFFKSGSTDGYFVDKTLVLQPKC